MDIKVRDLRQTETIENENKLMVLVDDDLNLVKNITKEEFLTNVISSSENNALVQETDGNLYVNTSEIADSVQALDDKFTEQIGDLSDLTTEDKTNLVAAINEAASSGGGGRNVGELVYSSLPLTDAGLHLLDGSLILGGGIYQGFVDYIADLYTENPSANYFTTEALWQQSVTDYGVCGKFVYDSVNNTVRLPKVTGIIEGTTDISALGDLVEESLPNITSSGKIYSEEDKRNPVTGAIVTTTGTDNILFSTQTNNHFKTVAFTLDASRSSSTYQDNAPVQPQTIKCFVYIVIANSSKTEIQVDIDEVATDLNGKADTDLTNATDQAKILMGGMAMPSDKYIDLTLGASGSSYTAPADGWFCSGVTSTTSSCFNQLINSKRNIFANASQSSGRPCRIIIPCQKSDSVAFYYEGGTADLIRFIYAQGSESEGN